MRSAGRRVDAGSLWCIVVLDDSLVRPRVAYAIGRAFGAAVERNRIRRRLRAVVAAAADRLPPGLYLIGARPRAATSSYEELVAMVDTVIHRIAALQASEARS